MELKTGFIVFQFVQNIAPPSLSRDRRINMEQNRTNKTKGCNE